MKFLVLIAKIFAGILNYFRSLFSRLLCFVKKRKYSSSFSNEQCIPTSIMVDNGKNSTEVNLVDWNTWEDDEKNRGNQNNEQDIDLFKDMQPVINKAKVVHVKKMVKAPLLVNELATHQSDSLSFKPQYQVHSELDTWEDEQSAWGDDLDDSEISLETDIMLKRTKQLERERRSQEQRKKKLEKEQTRSEKKSEGHIGVKIS